MKITKSELKKLIKEVTQQVVGEEEQPAEEEPAADAGALASGAGGEQKSDVGTALQYIQKVDNSAEFAQMAQAVIQHGAQVQGGKAVLTKLYRALPKMIKGMQEGKLNEDEAIDKPGGHWSQPGVNAGAEHGPPDESIRGTTAEIVASILDLLADYEIGLDGAREVVHELAAEVGLVPAEEEPKRPIGFRENLREALIKESFKRALTNAIKK
tara:strand:- start:68 stop:703 length:636 start_codon:yes stop_codon:yes gene_type:complete